MPAKEEIKRNILKLVGEYYSEAFREKEFIPGKSPVPYAGRVFDAEDLTSLVDCALDFWLTAGPVAEKFEKDFAAYFGLDHALLVNSGSSANLVAVSALTSPKLKERALKPGDEVITVASGFPTTINPIFQNALIPVFLDITIPTYNIDCSQLDAALSDRTRAIVVAHTLGNPFDLKNVVDFARKHNLWLIEDCCDALGAIYDGRLAGTFGDLATVSFYPAHHITMGEGGCVLTGNSALKRYAESFRDWGRDCYCGPGQDDSCRKRFEWQLGSLPYGYDHKFTYSHIGYNLKTTDSQAAVGLSQFAKLDRFIKARKANHAYLLKGMKDLEEFFILPEATGNSEPSWFGFLLSARENAPFTRNQMVTFLNERKISTRLLFGGNLVRQPAYEGCAYRIIGDLKTSDFVMNNSFWVGVYPGLTEKMLDYMLDMMHEAARVLKK